jgi:hypothetical protein
MSLVLQSSGGGSVTLQEPVTASNLTITVPAVTGTMLTTASAGTVLQVVSATTSTQTSNNTGNYIDTTLTASITPTSSSSKILVLASQNGIYTGAAVSNNFGRVKLVRNSTDLILFGNELAEGLAAAFGLGGISCSFLDSPATTSSTTYKTQFQNQNGSFFVQVSSAVSTITLLEIAA